MTKMFLMRVKICSNSQCMNSWAITPPTCAHTVKPSRQVADIINMAGAHKSLRCFDSDHKGPGCAHVEDLSVEWESIKVFLMPFFHQQRQEFTAPVHTQTHTQTRWCTGVCSQTCGNWPLLVAACTQG